MKSQKKPLIILLTAALGVAAQAANAENILRRGNGSEPHSLDPQTAEGVPESNILRDLFEGLIGEDASGNLVPGVAEKWEISADGKTYTFHLRDAKWSDGSPLTAHDFVYGWQRAVDPATGSHYSFLLYPVKNAQKIAEGHEKDGNQLGVKATDDHTLVAELEGPTPLTPHPKPPSKNTAKNGRVRKTSSATARSNSTAGSPTPSLSPSNPTNTGTKTRSNWTKSSTTRLKTKPAT